MPIQSPAQKTPKLKSVVPKVSVTKRYCDSLYRVLQDTPIEFVNYLMGTINHKAYDAEIRCLAIFPTQASILAHHMIESVMCAEVGSNHGVPPQPSEAEVPGAPV